LKLRKSELQNQTIETIYFGGGTPSLLTSKELGTLISEVYNNYQVTEKPEISLEANPDYLTNQRINELAKTRINRLSIGIQSFFEDDLQVMNRAHNSTEAKECLQEATKYFENISIDLIYGIPEMSLEKWNENLEQAFSLGINHISSYALTVEPKTALDTFIKKGTYPPIDEELALLHFNHLMVETEKQGFVHYEISNFGRPKYYSKHNTSYWYGKSYIGIGPSAHSFNGSIRSWNVSNNSKYINSISKNILPRESETLTINDQFNEYVMTGLRTIWGVSLKKIQNDYGIDFKEHLLSNAGKYIEKELLVVTPTNLEDNCDKKLRTTQKGKFLIDGIASDLFMI